MLFSLLCSISETAPSPERATAIVIGNRKQLLADDWTIARRRNVTREPGRPIMPAGQPWESDAFGFYGTVLYDEGRLRMWYRPRPHVAV